MSTPEVQAAVERATLALKHPETPSCCVVFGDDLRTILAALSEANERASILQTALHERTTERDEARKALASPPPPKGEDLPVAWADGTGNLFPNEHVSEWVMKLTRHAQPEYGFTQPLYARPSPEVSREEVARIIDGGAFNAVQDAINFHERYPEDGPWFVMSCAGDALHAVQRAYANADAILALLSRGEG